MTDTMDLRTRSIQMHLLLVLAVGFSIIFIVAGHPFLPAKYSYDEQKIAALARRETGIASDKSFQIVADIYHFLGLSNMPLVAGLIGFAAFGVVLYASIRSNSAATLSILKVILIASVVFLGAVYLGHYSKELFMLPISGLVLARFRTKWWDFCIIIFMVVYATYFRSYWLIVATFYLVFRILLCKVSPIKAILIGSTFGLGALSVVFVIFMGFDLDHYRLSVNDTRIDSVDAQTAIQPLTSMGGILGGLINALAVLVSFVFPVPLLIKGQVFYLLIVAFFLVLWLLVFSVIGQIWYVRPVDEIPQWIHRTLSLLFAFTLVQSIFEPDYGSYIRHLSPLLPLMISIILLQQRSVKVADSPFAIAAGSKI